VPVPCLGSLVVTDMRARLRKTVRPPLPHQNTHTPTNQLAPTHVHTYAQADTETHNAHAHNHTYIYAYTYTFVYFNIHIPNTHAYTRTHTHTHTLTHTHTHTQTHKFVYRIHINNRTHARTHSVPHMPPRTKHSTVWRKMRRAGSVTTVRPKSVCPVCSFRWRTRSVYLRLVCQYTFV